MISVKCLYIAGLELCLDSTGTDIRIVLPTNRLKFIQPVTLQQAGLFITDKIVRINLNFHNTSFPLLTGSEKNIFHSTSWEFWKDVDGKFIFLEPFRVPPIKLTVSPDFSNGELAGDYSKVGTTGFYPLEFLEISLFAAWLASLGDILLHASGIALSGKGYCFIGPSGAGKSTLAAKVGSDPLVTILGEDQVILRFLEGRFWIFGTPWHMDENMCSPGGVPLEKIFFLDKESSPGVRSISLLSGVTKLLQTAFIPYYLPEFLPGILDHLALLGKSIPFYTLSYQLGQDPWPLILNN